MESKRFVVQEHTTAKGAHRDLMLEYEAALATFRLEDPPEAARHHTIRAQKIFDHPAKFLAFEGPVRKGIDWVRISTMGPPQPGKEDRDHFRPVTPVLHTIFIIEHSLRIQPLPGGPTAA